MAALLTLEEAKAHLRRTAVDEDAVIQETVEEASDIILDYLKTRANKVATIETSSVASPTVIVTEEAHDFTTGDTATIEDHEDSTPDINGEYEVTVIDPTSFSIPEAVTVAGSGGTVTVEWDDTTAPLVVKRAVKLMLTHLFEHRGDDQKSDRELWEAIERILMRRRDPAYA